MISGLLSGGRAWVRDRPRTQKGGAAAAVVLLATAPFGGLEPVAPAPADQVQAERPFRLGPYEVTVARVVSTPELAPIVSPEVKGNRILSLVLTVTNTTDRPESLLLLTDAVRLSGAGVVAGDPRLLSLTDGTTPLWLNPDLTTQVALTIEHDPDAGGPAVVETLGYDYVDESTLTLDEDYWSPTEDPVRRGEIPVEERA